MGPLGVPDCTTGVSVNMAMAMNSPTKREGTDNWQYRRRIPANVQKALASLPKEQRPGGWGKTEIVISLGTADRAEAKRKCPDVAAEVERRFAALLAGARRLTAKEAHSLARDIYEAFAEGLEDDPGPAESWRKVVAVNALADAGRFGVGLQIRKQGTPLQWSLEERFGDFADTVLKRHGLIVDVPSRALLLEAISQAATDAALKLAHNATGDFSPDDNANRYPPAWEDLAKSKSAGLSVLELFDQWAVAENRVPASVRRKRQAAVSLDKFVNGKKAAAVTNDEVWAWALHLKNEEGRDPLTINKAEVAAIRTLYRWASTPLGGRLVSSNPALGVAVPVLRKSETRERAFTEAEAAAVLRAALAVPDDHDNPTQAAGRRWIPWLVAYSGARVGEMAQLRGQDIWQEAGAWVMRITPEAGTVKSGKAREPCQSMSMSSRLGSRLLSTLVARGPCSMTRRGAPKMPRPPKWTCAPPTW